MKCPYCKKECLAIFISGGCLDCSSDSAVKKRKLSDIEENTTDECHKVLAESCTLLPEVELSEFQENTNEAKE